LKNSTEERKQTYYREITLFIKNLTKLNISLSPKDLEVIDLFIQLDIPVEDAKRLIKRELLRYPLDKRKNFSLSPLEKPLKAKLLKKKKKTVKNSFQKNNSTVWGNVIHRFNIPPELLQEGEDPFLTELKVISFIWNKLPEDEKREIKLEALKRLKANFILSNIDKKTVLKSIIREIIKERYF